MHARPKCNKCNHFNVYISLTGEASDKCSRCLTYSNKDRKRARRTKSLEPCYICGQMQIHVTQLHVDHKDGNNLNYDKSNLVMPCSSCHSLKSYIQSYPHKWAEYCKKIQLPFREELTSEYYFQLKNLVNESNKVIF